MEFCISESVHKLPFLDTYMYIDNTGPAVVTRVFRKKTFTSLFKQVFPALLHSHIKLG